MILYHLCKVGDEGDLTQGYIGVTNDFEKRKIRHLGWKAGSPKNKKLVRALSKYPCSMYVVSEGTESEILRMEQWLRPHRMMGWNLAEGGGLPPSAEGRKWSKLQKQNVPQRGKDNYLWRGWWEVDGVCYESMNIAAAALGVSKSTVRNRCMNPKFTNYNFIPRE